MTKTVGNVQGVSNAQILGWGAGSAPYSWVWLDSDTVKTCGRFFGEKQKMRLSIEQNAGVGLESEEKKSKVENREETTTYFETHENKEKNGKKTLEKEKIIMRKRKK